VFTATTVTATASPALILASASAYACCSLPKKTLKKKKAKPFTVTPSSSATLFTSATLMFSS
jgi:hypothetical protein